MATLGFRIDSKIRSEGKDYVVQDGEVLAFRFNVETSWEDPRRLVSTFMEILSTPERVLKQ